MILLPEETDLIYEGIATPPYRCPNGTASYREETDLIYEGIATLEECNEYLLCHFRRN